MAPPGLEQAVGALLGAGPGGPAGVGGGPWAATRVGRNVVWKLTNRAEPGESYFAKFYESPGAYRRELGGLELAARVAAGRDWLMAAEVPVADEDRRFIVTRALPGVMFQSTLRAALRRDANPLRRRAALDQAGRALSLLVDWVEVLQRQPPSAVDGLQDDRPEAVIGRVAEKLRRLQSSVPGADLGPFGSPSFRLQLPPGVDRMPLGLVHGDLSSGNVYFDGRRVGVVDFENMAIGPTFRDALWVQYGLQQCGYRWYYRSCAGLLERLGAPDRHPAAGLYSLEFLIDHLLILSSRSRSESAARRVLGRAEGRWVRRELLKLSGLVQAG